MSQLRVFGALSLEGSDRARVAGLQRKHLALLAILAAAPDRRASRDKLLAYLWPESDTEHARNALNQAVHVVRRVLGAGSLSGTSTLELSATEISCDLWDFIAAQARRDFTAAVSLYSGAFLDGFYLREAGEFERWVESKRAQLARDYENALEQLAREAEARCDYVEAIGYWRKWTTAQPLSSRAVRGLIDALMQIGDRVAALQALRVHEQLVREQLHAAPMPEIVALAERVRRVPAVPNEAERAHAVARPANGHVQPAAPGQQAGVGTVSPRTNSAPGRLTRAMSPRRTRLALAALLIVTATSGLAAREIFPIGRWSGRPSADTLDPARFVVAEFANETGDPKLDYLGAVAADWVTQGLARLGGVNVVRHSLELWAPSAHRDKDTDMSLTQLASKTGAGTVVDGSFVRSGDSLLVLARVLDGRTGRVLQSMDPVSGSSGDPVRAIEALRDRLMSIVAARGDPLLKHWVATAGQPLRFDAYLEYSAGMTAFAQASWPLASAHFQRAAAIDTTYTLPLLWLVFARHNNGEDADSLVQSLESRRGTMPPLERAILDYHQAGVRKDSHAVYLAATRMVELAPGSEFLWKQAMAAATIGRPHEAVAILRRLNPNEGWIKDLSWYWEKRGDLEETIGDYEAALASFKHLSDASPTDGVYRQRMLEVLAALGRFHDIDSLLTVSDLVADQPEEPGWYTMRMGLPYRTAIALASYGHRAESRRYFERALNVLDSSRSAPNASKRDRAGWIYDSHLRAASLLFLGRLAEARAQSEELTTLCAARAPGVQGALEFEPAAEVGMWATLGEIAVLQRDTAEVTRVLAHLQRMQAPRGAVDMALAAIAAVAGDRDLAVRQLERAFAHGTSRVEPLLAPEFGALRSYPPFRELVAPRG